MSRPPKVSSLWYPKTLSSDFVRTGKKKKKKLKPIAQKQVNSAFNGKRKMLRKSLQHLSSSPEIEKALGVAGLPVTVSNDDLSVSS